MKIFIDTSSLIKKYNLEKGTKKVLKIFYEATEVYVSHITYMEARNTLIRRYRQKEIISDDLTAAIKLLNNDFSYFSIVPWDESIKNSCIKLIDKHQLKTLDIIQLGSAIEASTQLFVTSDKQQHKIAEKELTNTLLI
ncbi:hypothetical protein MNBD_UNCLBAC01-1804 [hydrothermal vent metagenome]|uniref:PIN domain-containing protein n=1 Tax=hydrothermal vent metagenome TaxID=652676 RepID=A0A3B1DGG5_9ZZZZ